MSESLFEPESLINLSQRPQERLHPNQIAIQESIPIIDLKISNWGFFQIINHEIPIEVLENVKQAAHDFFDFPVEEWWKYLKDNTPTHTLQSFSPLVEKVLEWKDYRLHFCDGQEIERSKLWPSVSRDQVLEYPHWRKPVIRKLRQILLKGINVEQIDEVKESALMHSHVVSLHNYPMCPNSDLVAGNGPHSDISSITILLQDDVGGLYVRVNEIDRWIHVTPIKGALVVNIGDVLQIMSNDRYNSIEHRVLVSGTKNRVSVPIIVSSAPNAVIGPLPEVLEAGEKPTYKQVMCQDYFNYHFSKGQDGKHTIDLQKYDVCSVSYSCCASIGLDPLESLCCSSIQVEN